MKTEMIHYIGKEWNSKFIIAKTLCGKDWRAIDEFTQENDQITCKKCILILTNQKQTL